MPVIATDRKLRLDTHISSQAEGRVDRSQTQFPLILRFLCFRSCDQSTKEIDCPAKTHHRVIIKRDHEVQSISQSMVRRDLISSERENHAAKSQWEGNQSDFHARRRASLKQQPFYKRAAQMICESRIRPPTTDDIPGKF